MSKSYRVKKKPLTSKATWKALRPKISELHDYYTVTNKDQFLRVVGMVVNYNKHGKIKIQGIFVKAQGIDEREKQKHTITFTVMTQTNPAYGFASGGNSGWFDYWSDQFDKFETEVKEKSYFKLEFFIVELVYVKKQILEKAAAEPEAKRRREALAKFRRNQAIARKKRNNKKLREQGLLPPAKKRKLI